MLAAAIAKHLHSLGLVVYTPDAAGGDCYLEYTPDTPDEVVVISGTGGLPQQTRLAYDRPTFQIRTRGPIRDPRPSLTRQQAIYAALAALDLVTLDEGGVDEVRVLTCDGMQSGPISIGQDPNQRPEHTWNYQAQIHLPTVNRPAPA